MGRILHTFYKNFTVKSEEIIMHFSVKNTAVAILISLGITACSSGGGSSGNSNNAQLKDLEQKLSLAQQQAQSAENKLNEAKQKAHEAAQKQNETALNQAQNEAE